MGRLAVLLVLGLAGCASFPTPQESRGFNHGVPIARPAAVTLVTRFVQSTAKDPDSVRMTCGAPEAYWTQNRFTKASLVVGYRIECLVNAKNSYGGYTGNQAYGFMIRDDVVRQYWTYPNKIPFDVYFR